MASFFLASLYGCGTLPSQPHLPKSVTLTQAIMARRESLPNPITPPFNPSYPNSPTQAPFAQIPFAQAPLVQTQSTLNHAINEQEQSHPALSGYYPLSTGANAFAARSILTSMASHSIDVQYYIWHDDEAGQLMLKDLWDAAERGVLVRILLDDFNGSVALDELLLHIDSHPNVSVRLINPMKYRKFRLVNYLTNPIRTGTRMHNKSMTFDNNLSIIGGRNIGDEYLNNTKSNQFADLDVLLIGEIVPSITKSFDEYWDSPYAYDIRTLAKSRLPAIDSHTIRTTTFMDNDLTAKNHATAQSQALMTYREAIATSSIGQDLLDKKIPFRWVNIKAVSDPPAKLGRRMGNAQIVSTQMSSTKNPSPNSTPADSPLLVNQLKAEFGTPTKTLSIISSYFVPTKDGVATLSALAKSGVDVRILTNSYDATDVGAVHAGYAHWRKDLLQAGVRLFELKSTATSSIPKDNKIWRTPHKTTTSLHAKAFAVDNERVFIGSYNVDPRSANINTEMGVIIDDSLLASHVHNAFNDNLLNQAYEIKLNHRNQLEWHTINNGVPIILKKEPNMQTGDKLVIFIMGLLPIDFLL